MDTMYEKLLELNGEVQPWVYNALGTDTPYVNYYINFPNGYGASLIKHPGSYGFEVNLWELAVIKKGTDGNWHLYYDTPITDDVIGYLTVEKAIDLCKQIRDLKKEDR
jgi:hypothetical protein